MDETEKGWYVTWIDEESIEDRVKREKKDKMAKDDEERLKVGIRMEDFPSVKKCSLETSLNFVKVTSQATELHTTTLLLQRRHRLISLQAKSELDACRHLILKGDFLFLKIFLFKTPCNQLLIKILSTVPALVLGGRNYKKFSRL